MREHNIKSIKEVAAELIPMLKADDDEINESITEHLEKQVKGSESIFLQIRNKIFHNRYHIAASFPGDLVGFLNNPGCLPRQFGIIRDRQVQFLVLPVQEPHRNLFFLLPEKTHGESPIRRQMTEVRGQMPEAR